MKHIREGIGKSARNVGRLFSRIAARNSLDLSSNNSREGNLKSPPVGGGRHESCGNGGEGEMSPGSSRRSSIAAGGSPGGSRRSSFDRRSFESAMAHASSDQNLSRLFTEVNAATSPAAAAAAAAATALTDADRGGTGRRRRRSGELTGRGDGDGDGDGDGGDEDKDEDEQHDDVVSMTAARLAEIGAHNVVATVAVEKDAVGSAVVSLADVAAAAAAKVVAEPLLSSSSSSRVSSPVSSATVSAPFSCPVTRLGRLRGHAEGTLVLTFLLPNNKSSV